MTAQSTTFDFHSHPVRVIDNTDHTWFVAADVAAALEYSEPSAMTRHLDDDEKGLSIVQTPGGEQQLLAVNESGLYHAVLKSRKPAAKEFRRWVTAEVLPAIRKTGAYMAPEGLTPAQQREIQNIVSRLAHRPGNTYASLYRSLKDHFQVGTYKDIPAERFDSAKAFLLGVESIEGDYQPAPPTQYHYPLETAKPRTMPLPQQAWLTHEAVLDPGYGRPCEKLLNELAANGHDISGAAQEYKALYLLARTGSSIMHEMRDLADNALMRGLNTWFEPRH